MTIYIEFGGYGPAICKRVRMYDDFLSANVRGFMVRTGPVFVRVVWKSES